MYESLIKMYAVLTVRVAAAHDEKGQGTLEYVGIVVVAAILVGAVVDAINGGEITSAISNKISEIINAG
ncbi:MAG: hypothetical protein ACTHKG_01335 [Nocardioides sp.]